jgi:hypothetical protein
MGNPIKEIMDGLVASMDAETPNEITYKDFMKADKDSSLYDILNTYDMASSQPHMILNKIIKQKYNITHMSNELYWYLREFPIMLDKMSDRIEEEEGLVCCVDKAWQRSFKKLKKLIIASGGTIDEESK